MKRTMCVVLLLGGLTFAPHAADAAHAVSQAQSTNSQAVGSATFVLAAVTNAADPNPGQSLALSERGNRAYFYLKNFGSRALTGFNMSQTSASATVRYCVAQEFKNGSATTCADNSTAILVGTGTSLANRTFTAALAPGATYAFAATLSPGSAGSSAVSVSVSQANIVTGTSSS